MSISIATQRMYLGGTWVDREDVIEVNDPQNQSIITTVPKGTTADMHEAIKQAKMSFDKQRNWPTHQRMKVLHQAADYVEQKQDEYASIIAQEGSKTIREAESEVSRCIDTLRLSAEQTRHINGQTIPFDQRSNGENRVGYYYRFPIGVIGAITPFNDPLNLVAHKIGPAIAAGNPIIVKPATETPLSALKLAEAFDQTECPPGMLSVITGRGRDIGDVLVTHPDVQMISFTGGLETGRALSHKAGLKKMSMELGSNSPLIILEDANIKKAVQAAVEGAFSAAGQNCIGVQRIYVHQPILKPFLHQMIQQTEQLQTGDKMNPATDMGPLIHEREAKRIEQWVLEALEEGATLHCGGKRDGAFYTPTILSNVPAHCTLSHEEVFGPVVLIKDIKDLDEGLYLANSVQYGLQAGIFTQNIDLAFKAIHHLEAGGVMVNDSSDFRIDSMPFGGVKGSGLGREGVPYAVEKMTDPKVVSFKLDH